MIARLFAIKIAVGLLLFTGCATAPRVAPRFQTPSTAPLERAAAANKTHVEQARTIVRQVKVSDPVLKLQLDKVINLLDQALADNAQLEGARAQLLTQLTSQADQANRLATDYDKAGAQITGLRESRHGWVKRFWMASGLLLVAGLWIFRKPLLLLVGL